MTATETEIDVELLRKFCAPPDHPNYSDVFNSWNYRGGSRVNYDLCATNGKVLLVVRQYHLPEAKEERCGAPDEYWWAMGAIADGDPEVRPAKDKTLTRVSESIHEQLKALPGLEFKEVPRVKIWSNGRGKPKQKMHKVNDDKVVFFRFAFGVGLCVAESKAGGGGAEHGENARERHEGKPLNS